MLKLAVFGCCVFVPSLVQPVKSDPAGENLPALAQRLLTEQETIGRKLTGVLSDKNSPIQLRIECARFLGKIRYVPAIPALIELIELQHAGGAKGEPAPDGGFPCVLALADYGILAMSDSVDAYVRERSQKKKDLLFLVLSSRQMLKQSRTYVAGLWHKAPEGNTKQELALLAQALALVSSS